MSLCHQCQRDPDEYDRTIRGLTHRVSDLKFALGDDAGWFDRAKAAEKERDATLARCDVLVVAVDAALAWRGLDGDGITDPVRLQLLAALVGEPKEVPK